MDTRARILDAAYGLFYRQGFARTGMDAVAAAAGVTKRTLYNRFESKDALAGAVLDAQADLAMSRIAGWAATAGDTPQAYVAGVFAALETWTRAPRWSGSGFTRLAMELAHMPGHPVRQTARRHKQDVEARLRDELARRSAADPATLARRIALLMEGAMCLCLIHDDPAMIAEAGRTAVALSEAT